MPNKTLTSIIAAALQAGALSGLAQDWNQWGGRDPGRNMYSAARNLPVSVDPGKLKSGTEEVDMATTRNVKWVAKLGSQSYGNAVVTGGKVFIGTNNENPRDKRHAPGALGAGDTGDRSVLMVFDEATGNFQWQFVVPKLASGRVNDWEGLGLLSSPNVEGNRIYLVTTRCEVVCLTTDGLARENVGPFMDEGQYFAGPGKPKVNTGPTDADIVWRYDMLDELGAFPHNAANCSVIILDDVVFTSTSNGQDWTHVNIPSPNSPSFIALDKKTGQLVGEDDARIGPNIFHGQWSSPSAGKVNGQWQVYYGGGDGVLYAFNSKPVKEGDSSFLKKIWWFDCNPPEYKVKDAKHKYPAPDGPSEIVSTPVFHNNRVYVAIGQDPEHGEGVGRLVCLDPTKTGDVSKSGLIWDYRGIHRTMSTVSITPDGLLFIADFSGFLHCLDADTGKLHWTHDLKSHIWGSTMVADGKVYIGDEQGDFMVLAASKEKKLLSTADLGAPVYSTAVIANGVLYMASNTHLYAFHDAARNGTQLDQQPKVKVDPAKP